MLVLCRRALLIVGRPARQGGTSKAEVPQARQRMENKHDCHTRLQRSMNRAAEKIKGSRTSAEVRILCRGGLIDQPRWNARVLLCVLMDPCCPGSAYSADTLEHPAQKQGEDSIRRFRR